MPPPVRERMVLRLDYAKIERNARHEKVLTAQRAEQQCVLEELADLQAAATAMDVHVRNAQTKRSRHQRKIEDAKRRLSDLSDDITGICVSCGKRSVDHVRCLMCGRWVHGEVRSIGPPPRNAVKSCSYRFDDGRDSMCARCEMAARANGRGSGFDIYID